MKFADKLRQLKPGERFETEKTKAVCYVTAKRAGLSITVEDKDGKRIVRLAGSRTDDLIVRLKSLSTADRLKVFEAFELCCGNNRGSCICEAETSEPIQAPIDDRKTLLASLQAKIDGITDEPKQIVIDDNWIEMPTTIENGETLYWHRKIKGAPVCYKRETNWDAFA